MKVAIVINGVEGLEPTQATWLLGVGFAVRGHEVTWVGVGDMGARNDGRVIAAGRALVLDGAGGAARLGERPRPVVLDEQDVVLLRTSPGRDDRDWAHASAMVLLRLLVERGVPVLNDPDGLAKAGTKLWLFAVPERFRPRTMVSRDLEEIRAFVKGCAGGAVLKPSAGTRGDDVFVVREGARENLNQIVEVLRRSGYVMAQEFVPEAVAGDMRLILVDGRPLVVDGVACAVRRVPSGDDFRSNVHVGATVAPGYPTAAHLELATEVGEKLRAAGIFLAGLDLIGDLVVEINAYSPGGLMDADRFHQRDFTGAIVAAVLERAQKV
ncbi:MAG: glutathione synthase [Deltaproteobacteria bacterium]|nr:MAG: glutathione synthase [Deltaproteobacteria bacterium]